MVASSGFDLPLIVDDAIQLSGGVGMTAQDVQNARTSLYLLLNSWSNKGYNTWRIRQDVDFILPSGSSAVPLVRAMPSNPIEDVVEARIWLSDTNLTPMTRMSPAEYGRLVSPNLAGLPTRYYLERTDIPTLRIHPTGRPGVSECVRLTVVERPAAFDRFGSDVDAPARWLNAIVTGVALGVAQRRAPLDIARVEMLRSDYALAESEALGADRQRIPWRLR